MYATLLPAEAAKRDEWQAAIEASMLVAERGGSNVGAHWDHEGAQLWQGAQPRKKMAKKYRIMP
ncbi:hypothetical protein AAFX91_38440 [Bradyrhizobium sp. 31Argb]|uniref:hypothetical protein n=1 Tax=Bradyrhizobium sp. 31Argb TaxID=3141247 RepID=UPI00374A81F0